MAEKQPATILLCDDSKTHRTRIRKVLIAENYRVLEAPDGIDAVQIFRDARPDLVLMDNDMSVMNGIDAIRYIRKINARAAVIILSAVDDEKTVLAAVKAGARDYLVKPVNPDLLLKTVRKYLHTS